MDNQVYLFPLPHSILFKKVTLPFHIFEARYRRMIHDAIERDIPVGIIPINTSNHYHGEICVAGVPHLITTYPDGRLDIYITGSVKCRLTTFENEAPYIIYSYKALEEELMVDQSLEMEMDCLKMMLEKWAVHFLPDRLQRETFSMTLEDPEVLINYCTVFLVDELTVKKSVMEASTSAEKVKILLSIIGPKEISLGPFMPTLRF